MKIVLGALGALLLMATMPARADVLVRILVPTQTMQVSVNGVQQYVWKVSTARRGYKTPGGTYRPYWLDRHHYSTKYNNAPMPYSIFFTKGYAIHGTTEVAELGRPASHGCVRLLPEHAAVLFGLVQKVGMANTRITVE